MMSFRRTEGSSQVLSPLGITFPRINHLVDAVVGFFEEVHQCRWKGKSVAARVMYMQEQDQHEHFCRYATTILYDSFLSCVGPPPDESTDVSLSN